MTTYRDLYERQAQLQHIGQLQGHREFTAVELDLALLDEVGEVTHELKSWWAWWKKPGSSKAVNPEKLLDEAADVVHFLLIRDLRRGIAYDYENDEVEGGWLEYSAQGLNTLWLSMASNMLEDRLVNVADFITSFAPILDGVGKTTADLVAAYFRKTDENLARWEAAKAQ